MSLRVPKSPRFALAATKRIPLEARLGDQHFALVAARAPRGGADRIASLVRLQRLVAVDDVDRRQRALEMGGEIFEAQFHGSTRRGTR